MKRRAALHRELARYQSEWHAGKTRVRYEKLRKRFVVWWASQGMPIPPEVPDRAEEER